MPAHAAPATAPEQGTHVVRPGETLWSIAREHMRSPRRWRELQRDNVVPAPGRLRPGQLLQIGTVAVVAELSGEAWLHRGNGTQQRVTKGSNLNANDVLITGHDAFLSLSFGDGSRVVLPSSSAMRLLAANGRRTRLELLGGRIESHVEKQKKRRFEIRARGSTMAVRGTHFRVRNEAGIATLEVIDGEVEASHRSEQGQDLKSRLGAGRGTLLEGQDALRPHALLPMPGRRLLVDPQETAVAPVPGAIGYRMQIAADAAFLQIVHETQTDAPQAPLPPALAPGLYHLRWTALDADGIEGMPGTSVIYWPGPPTPTTMSSEGTVRHLGHGRYSIRWPSQTVAQGVFELARDAGFKSPLVSSPASDKAETTVGPLELPGRYYWRVRNAGGDNAAKNPVGGSFEAWEPKP